MRCGLVSGITEMVNVKIFQWNQVDLPLQIPKDLLYNKLEESEKQKLVATHLKLWTQLFYTVEHVNCIVTRIPPLPTHGTLALCALLCDILSKFSFPNKISAHVLYLPAKTSTVNPGVDPTLLPCIISNLLKLSRLPLIIVTPYVCHMLTDLYAKACSRFEKNQRILLNATWLFSSPLHQQVLQDLLPTAPLIWHCEISWSDWFPCISTYLDHVIAIATISPASNVLPKYHTSSLQSNALTLTYPYLFSMKSKPGFVLSGLRANSEHDAYLYVFVQRKGDDASAKLTFDVPRLVSTKAPSVIPSNTSVTATDLLKNVKYSHHGTKTTLDLQVKIPPCLAILIIFPLDLYAY